MKSYDGAEVCELVGLFLLDKLAQVIDKNLIGLYRDDGLALLRNTSGTEMEKFTKTVVKIFKELGLKITSEMNLHQVDFLDVTLNLDSGTFWPFRKPTIICCISTPNPITRNLLSLIYQL